MTEKESQAHGMVHIISRLDDKIEILTQEAYALGITIEKHIMARDEWERLLKKLQQEHKSEGAANERKTKRRRP